MSMSGMANDDVVVSMTDAGDANRNVRISLRGAVGPEINLSVRQARALAMELLDIVQANGGSPAEDVVSSGKDALAETDLRSVSLKKVIFALPSLTAAAIGWKIQRFRQYSRVRYNTYRRPIVEIAGIKIPIDKHLSDNLRDAIFGGYYEGAELRTVKSKLDGNDRVMEIGTGIGFISSYCARLIGSERVFTFEANPALEPYIRQLYALNSVAPTLEICLLSDRIGEQTFYVEKDFWMSSTIRVNSDARPIQVPMKLLNEEIERIDPTFLILDIEGGEFDLFRYIDFRNIRKIAIELHTAILGREKAEFVKSVMAKHGFQVDERFSGRIENYKEELFLERQ